MHYCVAFWDLEGPGTIRYERFPGVLVVSIRGIPEDYLKLAGIEFHSMFVKGTWNLQDHVQEFIWTRCRSPQPGNFEPAFVGSERNRIIMNFRKEPWNESA